jgi:hypothetical protein
MKALSPIEKITIKAMQEGMLPYWAPNPRRKKFCWRQFTQERRFYRTVHTRTLDALVRKGLIVKNGTLYIVTLRGRDHKLV